MTEEIKPLSPELLRALARQAMVERQALPAPSRAAAAYLPEPRRIHVVCYEDYHDWILGKISRRLCEELERLGSTVSLGKRADPEAEINHHVIYWNYEERAPTIETVMLTHIDDERELGKVRRQLIELDVEMGICMSFEAVHRLAHFGVPRERLCFVGPAHDGLVKPRRTVVGLCTRLYKDLRKREHLLPKLARHISPDEFSFAIMGAGWDSIVAQLRARDFEVAYYPTFEPDTYFALLRGLDYYLYPGRDEGSIGLLDALAAGVPTIATAQGFHLDIPRGVTHAFDTLEDLRRVFDEIAQIKRARVESVASWTWAEFARKHALIWDYLYRVACDRPLPPALAEGLAPLAVHAGSTTSAP